MNIFFQITDTAMCELCKLHEEIMLHAILYWRELAIFWNSFTWFHQAVNSPPSDFCDLFSKFLQVPDEHSAEIFAITAWLIWNWRNSLHFGRPVHPLASLYAMAGNYLHEFLAAQELEPVLPLPPGLQQWRTPEAYHYKVNFDALAFKASNLASIVVIIRDWRGEAIPALSMPSPLSYNVNELEALACRRAVQFAGEIDLSESYLWGWLVSVDQCSISRVWRFCFLWEYHWGYPLPCCWFPFFFFFFFFFFFGVMLKEFVMLWPMLLLKRPNTCWGFGFGLGDLPEDISLLLLLDIHSFVFSLIFPKACWLASPKKKGKKKKKLNRLSF